WRTAASSSIAARAASCAAAETSDDRRAPLPVLRRLEDLPHAPKSREQVPRGLVRRVRRQRTGVGRQERSLAALEPPRSGSRRRVMPIKPEKRALYPKDWPAISRRIRFDRAQGRCEQ